MEINGTYLGKVNILGTDYEIFEQSESQNPKLKNCNGLCEQYSKKIVINSFDDVKDDVMVVENFDDFVKKVTRHEIIHAFLGESGLKSCSEWAENEEMVDFFANQFPKMVEAMKQAGCL